MMLQFGVYHVKSLILWKRVRMDQWEAATAIHPEQTSTKSAALTCIWHKHVQCVLLRGQWYGEATGSPRTHNGWGWSYTYLTLPKLEAGWELRKMLAINRTWQQGRNSCYMGYGLLDSSVSSTSCSIFVCGLVIVYLNIQSLNSKVRDFDWFPAPNA